ncbi:MAG: hypothetical protein EA362_03420 [Saprospirales bacterium]|nr:MAG: hypothetical protein EA362_03420 [Saprospirales bacterium]
MLSTTPISWFQAEAGEKQLLWYREGQIIKMLKNQKMIHGKNISLYAKKPLTFKLLFNLYLIILTGGFF